MSLSADDREYLRESRRKSGVPERINDSRTVEELAGLVLNSKSSGRQVSLASSF